MHVHAALLCACAAALLYLRALCFTSRYLQSASAMRHVSRGKREPLVPIHDSARIASDSLVSLDSPGLHRSRVNDLTVAARGSSLVEETASVVYSLACKRAPTV